MRKTTSLIALLLILLGIPVSINAQQEVVTSAKGIATAQERLQRSSSPAKATQLQLTAPKESMSLFTGTLKARPKAKEAKVASTLRRAAKRVSSVNDLSGNYIWTSSSLTGSFEGGRSVTVAALGTDSITLTNLVNNGFVVKAAVDVAAGKFYIPNQVVANDTVNNCNVDVCYFTITGGKAIIDRTKAVTGTINADGTLQIDDYWGTFVADGSQKDAVYTAWSNTEFEKANGRLVFTTNEGTFTYNAVIAQPSTNVVTVKNFAGQGHTVEIELQRDSTATIDSQVALYDSQYGNFQTVGVVDPNAAQASSSNFTTTITCSKAANNKRISWGPWSLLASGAYAGYRLTGYIEYDDQNATFTYPALSVSSFEGSGTEADPYQLKTLDDLILLSDKANAWEATDSIGNFVFHRSYKGKWFKVMNDIDMQNYRFKPISNSYTYLFAGNLDGGNHTISNLNVSSSGYAGLFGRVDSLTTIKDLTFKNANVTSTSSFNGILAGWDSGNVDNIHVVDSKISGDGMATGCVFGTGSTITNSDVINSTVTGLGGYVGGVAGEVDGGISNSYATGTTINAGGSENNPVGGVAGNLFGANAEKCYFTGTVYVTSSNMRIGGVFGTAYNANVDQVFSRAYVRGFDSKTQAGGVIGDLAASNLSNAYSTSTVIAISTVNAGGITGRVSPASVDGQTVQSSVTNAFSAGYVDAETYQYDTKNGVREALGAIDEGSNPTLSGIYFDNQITNNQSVRFSTPTSVLTSGNALSGYDASKWTFQSGYYPRLKFAENTEAAAYSSSALIFAEGNSLLNMAKPAKVNTLGSTKFKLVKANVTSNEGNYMSINGTDLVLNGGYGTDTLYVVNGKDSLSYAIKAAPVTLEGAGTEDNPYQIKTKADMIYLSDLTTNKNLYFPDTYFKMMNDIDMEYDSTFVGFANNPDDAYSRFAGTFDGGNHTLHNLYLGGYVVWKEKPNKEFGDGTGDPKTGSSGSKGWNGLFSRLDITGAVKNLTIAADARLEFFATAGPFVGSNYGLVENCRNYATVKGLSCWIGGITGTNEKEGIIRNCFNAGNVTTGYMCAGGITGRSYGHIENSMNIGAVVVDQLSYFIDASNSRDVTKLKFAGGIVGTFSAGTISNCVNAGTVYAYTANAGGIAGNTYKASDSYKDVGLSDIISTVNYGTVLTRDQAYIGSISAQDGSDGTLNKYNYYDKQTVPYTSGGSKETPGTTGVETSVLTSGQKLEGLADSLWQFEAGKYPVLKQFADISNVKTAISVIPQIASGEIATNLKSNITLNAPAQTTWQLTQGTSFKIEDGKVVVPTSVTSLQVDTLMATASDGYVKVLIIKQRYPFPLSGEGTAASPFLIKTAADWNAVADFNADCAEDFKGKYLRVENDIDFTGVDFKPIAGDFITAFNGNFDGNGKTISGIVNKSIATNQGGGAFAVIGPDGYVHDLTLEGKMTATHTYAGGFAGDVYGKVANSVNKIAVTSNKNYAAGFVAHAYGTAEFDSCYNRAEVSSSTSYIGGFAANVVSGAKFNACGNEGKVSETGTSGFVAGFAAVSNGAEYNRVYNTGEIAISKTNNSTVVAGLIAVVSGTDTLKISNSYNTASITAKGNVAGLITSNYSYKAIIEMDSCYNTGDIIAAATSATSSSPTAGLISYYSLGSKVTNSWNSGTIMSDKNVYAAGLLGNCASGNTTGTTIISNCYNTGDVVANGNQGAGIVAYSVRSNMIVENCYNTGNIEGGFGLGGIVGCLAGDTTNVIRNCYNTGNITTSTNRAGGLIGYGIGKGTVENCFNIGNVTTTLTAGGTNSTKSGYAMGGLAGTSYAHFYNCYNTGTVTGASFVGGLVGQPSSVTNLSSGNATEFHNCYNAGKVVVNGEGYTDEQKADTCGNIIGSTQSRYWNENNVMENTYFLSDLNAAVAHDAQATGLSAADMAKLDLGNAFKHNDEYSLPVLTIFADSAAARFSGVIPVAATGNTWQHITSKFYVGNTEGVKWTAEPADITFNGNVASFNSPYNGQFTVTATMGKWTKTFTLNADNATGINGISTGKEIKSLKYYTTDGMEISPSQVRRGQVIIIRKTFSDGSQATEKMAR